MPRYFAEKENINDDRIKIVGEDVKHISTVLRMNPGDTLEVCDGEGMDYACVIEDVGKQEIFLKILSKALSESEPNTRITLFQGLPKGDKMELIIQKSVELGVHEIVPVATERAVVKLDKKDGAKKQERWQKIALSAAKQSGRGVIPKICPVLSLKEALAQAGQMDGAFIAYELEREQGLKEALAGIKGSRIGILIGPEGGFSEDEVRSALAEGVKPVSLGRRILRTETAAIAVVTILLYELG